MYAKHTCTKAVVATLALVSLAACGAADGREPDLDAATEDYGSAMAATATFPVGATLVLELQTELSTEDNEVDDPFTATVAEPILRNGETAIPAGAAVMGRVTAVQGASGDMPAVLKLDFDRITAYGEPYPLQATVEQAEVGHESDASTAENAARVGVTTAAGAIVGRVIGGNATGTLVGAAVGAAAGTAIVLSDDEGVAVLERGSRLTIALTEPLTVRIQSDS